MDNRETIQLAYDSLGRRVSESDSLSGITINRVYAPRQETISLSSGAVASTIHRHYDGLGRPSVLLANGTQIAQWSYAAGAPSSIAYSPGTYLSFGYDTVGRVNSARLSGNGSSSLATLYRSFGSDNIPHQYTLKVGTSSVETNYFMTDDAGRVMAQRSARPGLSSSPSTLENSAVSSQLNSTASIYGLDGAANWLTRSGPQPLSTIVDSANRYSSINGEAVQNVRRRSPVIPGTTVSVGRTQSINFGDRRCKFTTVAV